MRLAAAGFVVLVVVFGAGFLAGQAVQRGSAGGPEPGATALRALGDRDSPVPLGSEGQLGGWGVAIDGVVPNASEMLSVANQFNVPPRDGMTFLLLDVRLRRRGVGSSVLRGAIAPALVVPTGTTFALGPDCGVLPDPLDPQALIAEGAVVTGQWCWELPEAQVDKVALRIAGTGGGAVWFSLR